MWCGKVLVFRPCRLQEYIGLGRQQLVIFGEIIREVCGLVFLDRQAAVIFYIASITYTCLAKLIEGK